MLLTHVVHLPTSYLKSMSVMFNYSINLLVGVGKCTESSHQASKIVIFLSFSVKTGTVLAGTGHFESHCKALEKVHNKASQYVI